MNLKYRLPITVHGYIDFEDGIATGVLLASTQEWAPLGVIPWSEDPDVVEIFIGDQSQVEGDVNIVEGIREALPAETEWTVE